MVGCYAARQSDAPEPEQARAKPNRRTPARMRRATLNRGPVALLGALAVVAVMSAGTRRTDAAETPTPTPRAVMSLVSVSQSGTAGNAASGGVASNADGSLVAFYSNASNLVPADTNGLRDVFVRDQNVQTTERVSVSTGGQQANGPSHAQGGAPALSGTGAVVAFYSDASNLVAGDVNGRSDVFIRRRTLGVTELVSVNSAGGQGNGASTLPSISADGRYVAFQSLASNLVAGDTNGVADIFVRDLQTNTTIRACGNVQGNGSSSTPAISADGRVVAFASLASNLVAGDTNGKLDVFVCDLSSGTIERVSVDSSGVEGDGDSMLPALNGDGSIVGFKSYADNLVPDDTNDVVDVFVRDRVADTTERISVSATGGNADAFSFPPAVSADGRFVAFGSAATNLVPNDTNVSSDIFVRDRKIGVTVLQTQNQAGQQANGGVPDAPPAISADGMQVALVSSATNLVPTDTGPSPDAYSSLNVFFNPDNGGCPDGVCPSGQVCVLGFCEVPTPTGTPTRTRTVTLTPTPTRTGTPTPTFKPCTTDADCPDGEHCRAGYCKKERPCTDYQQCFDREACIGQTCECGGDCNTDGVVLGNEITKAVLILGGVQPVSSCSAADVNGDGMVLGNEITLAVLNLGLGCLQEGRPLLYARDRGGMVTFSIESATAADGQSATVSIGVSGGQGEIATAQMDLLFDPAVLDPGNPTVTCKRDGRLSEQVFLATLPTIPASPSGLQRLRLFVGDISAPIGTFADGAVFSCTFAVKPGAPAGTSTLGADLLNVGDMRGDIFGSRAVSGGVVVTLPTPTPVAEPTAPRPFCAGDCNGDGVVFGNEVTTVVRVMTGATPLSECPAADADGDGEVFVTDIARAVLSIGLGCPQ